ncbi:sialate O-acetylesterase [Granulosicoccus antarcticus]|uniref:Alpha-amylase n=1 Tax=Granulosicoccus antarcticus IMCC3135 TaxID=1192854 RepID=A0A2Z2P1I2_9GAMM|nr:sialate O-acetylesterase [Granulosicoccus antarcticus]ASJ76675.1 Alpha-amylase [Granulosicoccus antarcticus IMCC3135]
MFKTLLLLVSLVSWFCLPGIAVADDEPPSSPGSLRAVRYSPTAGEVLWNKATDNVIVVGYRVFRDGEFLGIKDARSLYEPSLAPGQSYTYRVSALDRSGNEGPAMMVVLSGKNGTTSQGEPVSGGDTTGGGTTGGGTTGGGTTGGGTTGGGTTGGGTDDGKLTLYSNRNRVTLIEGDAKGVSVGITLSRGTQKRAVTLSLVSSNRDMLGMHHTFSKETLAPSESGSVLSLTLDVTVAPLLIHERYFQIVADDGVSKTTTPLTIDITPTPAPDVYLLIGQSNMEGYSEVDSRESYQGGRDERVERIRQLNVQPNNDNIFSSDSSFTNESTNVREPKLVIAEDALHEPRYIEVNGKGATFVGLGLTFAKQALRMTTAEIYLVPAAWGATGFCANANGNLAWNASKSSDKFLGGTLLADRALTRLNMTLRETGGVLRGILWHQGGADSNNPDCARTYADNLLKLSKRLRREARQDSRGSSARGDSAAIPFMVATQSKGDDERGRFSVFSSSKQKVDAAHRSVRSYISYSGIINNDDLTPPQYPCGQVSCVHFGADALREQGRRYYSTIKGIWSELGAYHY